MHKLSRQVVNYLALNDINTLIIGKNIGQKQNIKLGKRNNQNFVQIPFNDFIGQLSYKCRQVGINVILTEESYTSKCSFLDNEAVQKHQSYLGKRIKRGLFKSSTGKLINADVNGACNILRKYLTQQATWNDQIWSNLVQMCSTSFPKKVTPIFG